MKRIWAVLSVTAGLFMIGWNCKAEPAAVLFRAAIGDRPYAVIGYSIEGKSYTAVRLIPQLAGQTNPYNYHWSKTVSGNRITLKFSAPSGESGSLCCEPGNPGANYIKLSHFTNLKKLRLEFSSQALVVPDKTTEDTVIYPADCRRNNLLIPSDNLLLLNMLNNGKAILTTIWKETDLQLIETRSDDGNFFSGLEVIPTAKTELWLGLNIGKNIWYMVKKRLGIKATAIDWQPPFAADWMLTMRKRDGSEYKSEFGRCDSWKLCNLSSEPGLLLSGNSGVYIQHKDGKTWSSCLGSYVYPFIIRHGKVTVAFPKFSNSQLTYDKKFPPLIYPIQPAGKKALEQLLPYAALEKIAGVKVLPSRLPRDEKSRYPATCGITHKVEKIFYRDESRAKRRQIIHDFERMNKFVLYGHWRADCYLNWSRKMLDELKNYGEKHPAAARLVNSLRKDIYQIEQHYAEARDKIKNPAYCEWLTQKIVKLAASDKDEEAKEDECKDICRQIRVIGGRQDDLLAEFRLIVKSLRQRVTELLLENRYPEQRQMLMWVRRQSDKILHSKFPMEGK